MKQILETVDEELFASALENEMRVAIRLLCVSSVNLLHCLLTLQELLCAQFVCYARLFPAFESEKDAVWRVLFAVKQRLKRWLAGTLA